MYTTPSLFASGFALKSRLERLEGFISSRMQCMILRVVMLGSLEDSAAVLSYNNIIAEY